VIGTGMNTEIGKIAAALKDTRIESRRETRRQWRDKTIVYLQAWTLTELMPLAAFSESM